MSHQVIPLDDKAKTQESLDKKNEDKKNEDELNFFEVLEDIRAYHGLNRFCFHVVYFILLFALSSSMRLGKGVEVAGIKTFIKLKWMGNAH